MYKERRKNGRCMRRVWRYARPEESRHEGHMGCGRRIDCNRSAVLGSEHLAAGVGPPRDMPRQHRRWAPRFLTELYEFRHPGARSDPAVSMNGPFSLFDHRLHFRHHILPSSFYDGAFRC